MFMAQTGRKYCTSFNDDTCAVITRMNSYRWNWPLQHFCWIHQCWWHKCLVP